MGPRDPAAADTSRIVDEVLAQEHADAAGLSVDADNVLYVRKAILDEYEELADALRVDGLGADGEYAVPYGGDPVSLDASVAFPERVTLLLKQCREHVDTLLAIAGNLEAAAVAYGYTDAEIAAATPRTTVEAGFADRAEIAATINAALYPGRSA